MKKVANVVLWIFGIGVTVCVLAGALSLLGFIVALCIGGETATTICVFIHKEYFPWVIMATSVFTGIGLIGMYFNKTRSLSLKAEKEEKDEEKKA